MFVWLWNKVPSALKAIVYHRVSMTKAHTLEIATCSLFAHYQVTCIMPNLLFILSYSCNNAQCLYQKWKLEIQVRFPLQHPFFPGIFISDKLIVDWPLPSFTFDIYLRTSWTQPTAEEEFKIELVSIQAGCRKDVNEILRTSWM